MVVAFSVFAVVLARAHTHTHLHLRVCDQPHEPDSQDSYYQCHSHHGVVPRGTPVQRTIGTTIAAAPTSIVAPGSTQQPQ